MGILHESWHWSFSGFMIAMTMLLLIYFGKRFGVSSSFRTICSIGGAGKFASYFNYNWKSHDWLLLFVIGSVIGGFLSSQFLENAGNMELGVKTLESLKNLNLSAPIDGNIAPKELLNLVDFSWIESLLMLGGGILIGFGTRYAKGCTSGHAISGLSNLQLPSLIAVIGFFLGGLAMTYFILPMILS